MTNATRYIYYTVVLCMMASCSQTNDSVTRSMMTECNEKTILSFSYNVVVYPATRSLGYLDFVLDVNLINNKVSEILTRSDIFSPPSTITYVDNKQDRIDIKNGISDYHFTILIGWDEVSITDELMNEGIKAGIVAGSGGLVPVTISDTIEINIIVESQHSKLKTYNYEKSVSYVYWAPVVFSKLAANEGSNLVIGSDKCMPKIENMMEMFTKDFSKDICSH